MQHSFTFPADTAVLERISELTAEAGRNAGFSEDEIGDIVLAIDEACTNTIIHGLKRDSTRDFQLVIKWERDEIDVSIHEDGEPFEITYIEVPDPEASLEDRPVGGLGFFFIRKLMDEVESQIGEDGMKILRMVKRKARSEP